MRLYIAEKPSMAREIAAALPGPSSRKNGYIETGGGLVTWCVGHLLEQVEPAEYDEKYKAFPGSFADLPIVPTAWKLRVAEGKTDQVRIIKGLLKQCSEVVNAGDPGREGQLIIDELLEFAGNRKPVLRLLLPSLDKPTVQKAIAQMQNNAQFAPLYQAALCRQRADWLVGMNLTRSYTLLGQKQGYRGVLSIGRVQTPTLAIVVRRDLEIESFKPVPYWTIHALCQTPAHPDRPFWATWVPPGRDASAPPPSDDDEPDDEEEDSTDDATLAAQAAAAAAALASRPAWLDDKWRLIDGPEAQRIAQRIRTAAQATVVRDERKSAQEPPPLPFELTGLTARINARTGASGSDILKACQSLYEGGYASYPRSDCAYMPTALFGNAPAVLAAVAQCIPALAGLIQGANTSLKSRAWNDAKVGEHYAITPTATAPNLSALGPLEQAVYEAISRQYLAQFYPNCLADKALIELESAGERLVARGRVVTDPGWRVVFSGLPEGDGESVAGSGAAKSGGKAKEADPTLPPVKEGDVLAVPEVRVDAHTTKPPPRFTEGTLTQTMKHVYRLVNDPVERKKLKSVEGIGRSATRAAIIQNLIKRTFLMTEGKKLISSPAARVLVGALPKPLVDPGLTARWEQALDTVAQGNATLAAFMGKQAQWIQHLVSVASTVVLPPLPAAPSLPPSAGKGASGKGRSAARTGGARTAGKPPSSGSAAGPGGGAPAARGAAPSSGSLDGTACPACKKGKLQQRTVRAGQHAGAVFYGCSDYPTCKHSVWPKK